MDIQLLEKVSACALNRIFGYEPLTGRRLVEAAGSAAAVFSLNRRELASLLRAHPDAIPRICARELDECASQLDSLERQGFRFISWSDRHYPHALSECPDAPLGLYVRSDSPLDKIFNTGPCISIVGTRDMSLYGKEWCTRIVLRLAQSPSRPAIVSGLATGVDITAHMCAVSQGLPTIAVLPTGINEIYPARHRIAAEKIASSPGCALITDYPPGTGARAVTFLRRNRIIAGLSQATILVESKIKGGGMITARFAGDYGRDLYVLPGRIDDCTSQGCNLLLAKKLAEPIVDLGTLPSSLGLDSCPVLRERSVETRVLDFYRGRTDEAEALARMVSVIRKQRGITVEELSSLLGWDYALASRRANLLESDSFISTDVLQRCIITPKNV